MPLTRVIGSKDSPLWVRAVGTVFLILGAIFLIPGILWIIGSSGRLNETDVRVAGQPFKRIQLNWVNQGPISVTLTIPNTKQWTKIRKVWGEPEFVITAGDSVRCPPATPVRIELTDSSGKIIPLKPGAGVYGYSSRCASSGLRFHAPSGSELTLKLSPIRLGATVPAADLVIVGDWVEGDSEDRIVSVEIDKFIGAFVKWLSITGFVLVISGAAAFIANGIPRTRPN